jgi:ribonuclease-3
MFKGHAVNQTQLARCQETLGYTFSDPGLLQQALTHASSAPSRVASNERLEFLGDAVLGIVICQEIFARNPELLEGEMTKIKSSVVSRQTCAKIARKMGITDMLILGKGVGPAEVLPSSVGAAVLESVIGAIYLDGGIEAAREFILRQMSEDLASATASQHQRNFKSLLQQCAQREMNAVPVYDVLDEKGPEHAKCFEVAVRMGRRQFPSAWGKTKKEAEQKAALAALGELGVVDASAEDIRFEDIEQ